MTHGFGYDGEEPVPARPEAAALASALFNLINAERELIAAKRKVPDYTGQWSSKDYYANEQEEYNRAVDAYAEAVIICGGLK